MIIDGGVHVESQGVELETTAEADMFDVALEEVVKGRRGTTGGGINHKRQEKDQKYGFGDRKKFAMSTDAKSSSDLSGFSYKNKAQFTGTKNMKPTIRLGKSKRAGGGGRRRRQIDHGWTDEWMDN